MKRKVVTICGSLKFWDKIQEISERLEIEYAKAKGKEIIYLENS